MGAGAPRRLTTPTNWKKPAKWQREAEKTGRRPGVYLGIPLCSDKPAEMQKVADLFTRLKPYIKTFSGKAGTIREGLAAGEIAISPCSSGRHSPSASSK
jgi:hypothetical protein